MVVKNNPIETKEIKQQKSKEYYINLNTKKIDLIFFVASLIVIFLLSYLLYKDIYKSFEGIGEPVGVVAYKKRTALRKLKNQSLWEFVKNEYPIYNGDSIKTEEFSEATIILKDGTEITINENSFIVINFSEDETKINFNYGSLDTKTSTEKQVVIQTKDSEIELTSAKAQIVQSNESLKIQINEGTANLKKDNQKQEIKQNEIALLDKNKNEITKQSIPLTLITPEQNQTFLIDKNEQLIQFEFQGDPEKKYEIWIALNPLFRPVLYSRPIQNRLAIPLREGFYYWKIIEKGQDPSIFSYRNFRIIKKEKPNLFLPQPKQIFNVKDSITLTFSWSKMDLASSYELWLDKDINFSNPMKIETMVNNLNLNLNIDSDKEIYYWKVVSKSNIEDAILPSDVQSFTLQRLEKLKPAILIYPLNEVFFANALKEGITFKWKYDIANIQTLEISKDLEFKEIVLTQKNISQNFFSMKNILPVGKYYWRIINEDNIPSNPGNFSISDQIDITLIAPKNNDIYFNSQDKLLFKWNANMEKQLFLLTISEDAGFKKVLFSKELTENTFFIEPNLLKKEGMYYWKVELWNRDTKSKITEKVGNFYFYYLPEKIKFTTPQNNITINLIQKDQLLIQWEPTKYADSYAIELYKNGNLIIQNKINKNFINLTSLNDLGIGIYDLKIYSLKNILDKEFRSDPENIRFILEYKIEQKPEFLTPRKILAE